MTNHLLLSLLFIAVSDQVKANGPPEPEITVREHIVFDGDKGWEHGGITYRLVCGAAIKEAPNGDLLCWWLSGSGSEPATDNNVLVARSTDKGNTWGEPSILIPAGAMAGAMTCMYPTNDGRIIAFGAHWPADKRYTVWHYFRMESKDNGHTWSDLKSLSVHNNNIAFGSPIRLANGEHLFSASFFDERPKPLVAPVSALVHAKTEAEALAMPRGEGRRHDEKFLTHRHGCSVLISPDENANQLVEYGYITNRPLGLLEPSCIQLKDGRIVMFMRPRWPATSGVGKHGQRPDLVGGLADGHPQPNFRHPHPALTDGRIALLHNACGEVGKMIRRDPMSIWISDDELETWSIKADIIHGGWLAYPCGYDPRRQARIHLRPQPSPGPLRQGRYARLSDACHKNR